MMMLFKPIFLQSNDPAILPLQLFNLSFYIIVLEINYIAA